MLAPNTLLQGRYLVMRLLGQGGMGAVYQATDRKFGNAVALKETFYNDLQLRKAFSHEARLLNRLRHAALPVVTDYFAIGERQFLVMQYIPGKDLEQLLADRKAQSQGVFMPSQVLRWADQLLDALEYLHSQKPPIIHRDIKPQNLKLTPRGEVILLDFGLAKGIVTHQSQVSQSIRGYTPNYASLEQIRGTGTDSRSDLYSIGATMYHLLTGEMPQDALTRIAAILMSQADPLKPVVSLNPEVPVGIAQVIEKSMAPHPDQRYSSAAAMRQALRSVALNSPPANLHRAQTLTDEPSRARSGDARQNGRGLPPPPVMRPASGQPQAAQAQGKPGESQVTDHVIVLLDKVGQNSAGKGTQARIPSQQKPKDAPIKADRSPVKAPSPSPAAQVRAPALRESPSKAGQEKNGRPKGGAKVNGVQANGAAARKKDVQGKSFFLKKVQQQQEKKLQPAKQAILKKLPYSFVLSFLITLVLGIGAYEGYKMWPPSSLRTKSGNSTGEETAPISERVEALRYYLEVASSEDQTGEKAVRSYGISGLEPGAKFKLHFKPAEGGYLYLISLGENLVPQTFLRSVHASLSDDEEKDYKFPDTGQWFMIDKEAARTPFTVIYSKTPLKKPAFFSAGGGKDLNATERQELIDLKKRYAKIVPELVPVKAGKNPFISVQSLERAANEPVIFDISINRR